MSKVFIRLSVLCLVSFLCAGALSAATFTTLIPSSAPHGARVIIVGSGFDATSLAVNFSTRTDVSALATITDRSETVVELTVPAEAISGPVTITIDGATVGTTSFTLAADPPYAVVRTLVRSDGAHNVLKAPTANVVLATNGNAYVADTEHHQLRVIGSDGTVGLIIGTGRPGHADGPVAGAEFLLPAGVAIDESHSILYIADTGNHLIRSIGTNGVVTTVAGSGRPGFVDGRGQAASFNQPTGLAMDANGNLFVADRGNNAIRRVAPDGTVTTIAGGQRPGLLDGPSAFALFQAPQGIAVRSDGAIFVADAQNHVIRMLLDGIVSTIAGAGTPGYRDGNGRDAQFHLPTGVTIDEYGTLVVADQLNNAIRAVSSDGSVTTIAGSFGGGYLDGPLEAAVFSHPSGVMSAGAVYIADTMNDAIRTIERRVSIAAVYPASGPLQGGNVVRIFGAGFQPGRTSVRFGTAEATVTFVTSTLLKVTVPSGTTGAVGISVTTTAGNASLSDAYTYIPGPTIGAMAPSVGPTTGGQSVTVSGSNFVVNGTRLSLDDHDLTDLAYGGISQIGPVDLATTISGTTPVGENGAAALRVVTPVGEATLPEAYNYVAPPLVAGFSPAIGFPGTTVTITGENFRADGTSVRFGGTPATVLSISATQITIAVPTEAVTAPIEVATIGGSATTASNFVVPVLVSISVAPPTTTLSPGGTRQLTADGTYSDGSVRELTTAWSSRNANVATVTAVGLVTAVAAGSAQITASTGTITGFAEIQVTSSNEWLPPDPATVAPPIDLSVAASFGSTVSFLYTGPNPVQRDVIAGAINAKRICVLRGAVSQRDGQSLAGVTVTVIGHPELGYTSTRTDGRFDIAVNGGGTVTLQYEKAGYIPIQRQVMTPWRDFASVPDAVMIPYDSRVTTIDFSAITPQVAQGSAVTDTDGQRAATLLFVPGTQATITLANGSTQPATSLHVRATEYTVGPRGKDAMPAPLPPSSGYTYCVELSADEVPTGGTVRFSQPVVFYVDNFLGFPVGTNVPVGSYDRAKGVWLTEEKTKVIKIVSTAGGIAAIDTNGDGSGESDATLESMGITQLERATMASRFAAGQSLWRNRISHFTPFDHNAPILVVSTVPEGAVKPDGTITAHECSDCTRKEPGSIIETDNRVLGEALPIAGTPYTLQYSSARVPGRSAARTIDVALSGAAIPVDATRMELTIEVAGKRTTQSFSPAPNISSRFTWDGKDVYGRTLTGTRDVKVTMTYVYRAVYQNVSPLADFGAFGNGAIIGEARIEVPLTSESHASMRPWDARAEGLGGWMLSSHHAMDVEGGVLLRGDGSKRTAAEKPGILSTVAGREPYSWGYVSPDGTLATSAYLYEPMNPMAAPDGSIYFISLSSVRKIDAAGVLRTVAPYNASASSNPGDGNSASQAGVYYPQDLALGRDGSVYITEPLAGRIVRVSPDGIMHHVAGNGAKVYAGDDGPATAAAFADIRDIACGPDGSAYVADSGRVRRIDPSGIITTVAMASTWSLAVGKDGSIFYADTAIRRIAPDGTMSTIGGPTPVADCPSCLLGLFNDMVIGPDGDLYIEDGYYKYSIGMGFVRVVRIAADGSRTVVVNGRSAQSWADRDTDMYFGGDGGFATHGSASDSSPDYSFTFNYNKGIAIGPDGAIYIGDRRNRRIRRVSPSPFKTTDGELRTTYGGETIVFDSEGRHTRTLHPLTGIPLASFSYTPSGRLAAIVDADGNVTSISHAGSEITITAPGGQTTTLTLDSNGWLSSITNPAGETTVASARADGLLESLRTPRNHEYQFNFDDLGRLLRDTNPASGYKELNSTTTPTRHEVTLQTAMGRLTRYLTEKLTGGVEKRTTTDSAGIQTVTLEMPNANGITEITSPDGTKLTLTKAPDAFFGMESPVMKRATLRLPSGLAANSTETRSYTRVAGDANRIATAAFTYTFGGRVWQSSLNNATRTLTTQTPGGRTETMTFDSMGRALTSFIPGLLPATFTYDEHGRLRSASEAGIGITYGYDAKNRLETVTDSIERTVRFIYDDADRPVRQVLPDRREITFSYDRNGNLESISPPSRPAHRFTFTAVDAPESYSPPAVENGGAMTFGYNADQQLTLIHRPDGREIGIGYDDAGRMSTISIERGAFTIGYDANGKVSNMTAPDQSVIDYTFDGPLPKSVSWRDVGTVGWTWDANLRVTQEAVSGTNPISFGYDLDGLLTSAGSLSILRLPANGIVDTTTLGTTTDKRTYKPTGRLDTYAAKIGNDAPIFSQTFTYDAAGRITDIEESRYGVNLTKHFDYDTAGRLWKATSGGTTTTHLYDDNGNRTSKESAGTFTAATYDNQDRLLTYGDATYTYNENGDLQTKQKSSGTTTYAYDEIGNLLRVELPDGRLVEYLTDAQNRRVGRKVNGVLVARWLYGDQLRIVAELDGSGNVISRFVYGTRSNVLEFMIRGGATYRIVSDHLGSPQYVLDAATGAIVQAMRYDEFGNVLADTNPGFQPFGFAGGLYDRDTGLVRFGARDYDSHTGRWTAKDPIGFDGGDTSLYGYVLGDPINLVDPSGLYGLDEFVEDTANYSAGFGDTMTFGVTNWIREQIGGNEGIERCSGAYAAGMYSEIGAEMALTGASFALRGTAKGITQAAARRGLSSTIQRGTRGVSELHHISPLKTGLFPTAPLPAGIRHSRRNLEILSIADHRAAHRALVQQERLLSGAFNPATTAGRVGYAASEQCGCP